MTTEQRLYLDTTCAKALMAEANKKYETLEYLIGRAVASARKASEARVAAADAAERLRALISEAHILSNIAEDGIKFAIRADLPGASEEALESYEELATNTRYAAAQLYDLAVCAEETVQRAASVANCQWDTMNGWVPRSTCADKP